MRSPYSTSFSHLCLDGYCRLVLLRIMYGCTSCFGGRCETRCWGTLLQFRTIQPSLDGYYGFVVESGDKVHQGHIRSWKGLALCSGVEVVVSSAFRHFLHGRKNAMSVSIVARSA